MVEKNVSRGRCSPERLENTYRQGGSKVCISQTYLSRVNFHCANSARFFKYVQPYKVVCRVRTLSKISHCVGVIQLIYTYKVLGKNDDTFVSRFEQTYPSRVNSRKGRISWKLLERPYRIRKVGKDLSRGAWKGRISHNRPDEIIFSNRVRARHVLSNRL